ncbi:MAG: hypothetical protein ACI8Z9_000511 [Paraglaciecola sp.]|jgi:hypothetical protein
MPTPTFWQGSSRKIALGIGLIVLLLLGLFLFRQPLAKVLLQQFANKYNARIDCLDFKVDGALNITLSRLCISHPQAQILIKQAVWHRQANTISIRSALITHLPVEAATTDTTDNSDKLTAPDLGLPKGLPQMEIKQLTLRSPLLHKALSLQLSQASSESITLSGDIQATLHIAKGNLTGAIEWSLADLSKHLHAAQQFTHTYANILNGPELPSERIISTFEFDGQRLSSINQVALSTLLAFESCQVNLSASGNIKLAADISAMSINLDLGQLSIQSSLQDCVLLQGMPKQLRPREIKLSQSSAINITEHDLTSKHLRFSTMETPRFDITLSELIYRFDGESSLDYGVNLSRSSDTEQQRLIFASSGHLSHGPQGIRIDGPQNSITLSDFMFDGLSLNHIIGDFGLRYSSEDGLSGQGALQSKNIGFRDTNIASLATQFSVSGPTINLLTFQIHNQLENIRYQDKHTPTTIQQKSPQASSNLIHAKQLTSELILQVVDAQQIALRGTSTLGDTSIGELLSLKRLTLEHSANLSLDKNTVASEHNFVVNNDLRGKIEQTQGSIRLHIPQQGAANLQNLLGPLLPELTISEGSISANASLPLVDPLISGHLSLNNIKALYQQYSINDVNFQGAFTQNSAGLQLAPSRVAIASLDVGVPINNLQSSLEIIDSKGKLSRTEGDMLGGRFGFADLWLDGRTQSLEISLRDIELAKLLELQHQAGMSITGKVKGSLPIKLGSGGLSINEGFVLNQGPGTLRINNNPAFDAIKAQQAELVFLENMDFERLSSSVKLAPDGWLLLDFSLLGTNPEKKQSVNFNYSHQENIFTLLQSLRLSNSVENTIKQKTGKGGGK